MNISIIDQSCINCKRCIEICPSKLFILKDNKPTIPSVDGCIECGHCVGVCPMNAIDHSLFPPDKIHKIDYTQMPQADQLMLLMKSRRSNRAFSNRAIPVEKLIQIVEAAHRAPTATNSQNIEFLLITNKEKLKAVSNFTAETFLSVGKILDNFLVKAILKPFKRDLYRYLPKLLEMKQELENGNDTILRNATALILIHAPKGSRFGSCDSNLAYQNASLMAESLEISQFYTGFVLSAIQQKKGKLEEIFSLEGREIFAGMALGIPEFRFKNYIDKKETEVRMLL